MGQQQNWQKKCDYNSDFDRKKKNIWQLKIKY